MEQRFLNASVIKKNWKKLQGLEEFNFKWESWVKFCNQELALPINTSELLVFGELWTLKLPLKTIRAYSICAVICGMTGKGRSSRSFLLSKHSAGVKAPLSLDAKHTRRGFFVFLSGQKELGLKFMKACWENVIIFCLIIYFSTRQVSALTPLLSTVPTKKKWTTGLAF